VVVDPVLAAGPVVVVVEVVAPVDAVGPVVMVLAAALAVDLFAELPVLCLEAH
jgi:hypothetical protein